MATTVTLQSGQTAVVGFVTTPTSYTLEVSSGIRGDLGYTGSVGPQGSIGFTGSAGATGATGPIGPTGFTGSAGSVGPQGSIGFTGSAGDQGSTGPIGFTGSAGATGPVGPTGFTGSEGAAGPTGFTGSKGDIGYTGSAGVVSTSLTIDKIHETFVSLSNANGTFTHDCSNTQVFNHTSIAGNFTANFTNLNLANNYATSLTLILNQGATPYVANAVQIGGAGQTVNWQGNTAAPVGNANKKDIMSFSIINNSGTYTVFGQLTSFG